MGVTVSKRPADRAHSVRVPCYCTPECNSYRWADSIEAIELGLFDGPIRPAGGRRYPVRISHFRQSLEELRERRLAGQLAAEDEIRRASR